MGAQTDLKALMGEFVEAQKRVLGKVVAESFGNLGDSSKNASDPPVTFGATKDEDAGQMLSQVEQARLNSMNDVHGKVGKAKTDFLTLVEACHSLGSQAVVAKLVVLHCLKFEGSMATARRACVFKVEQFLKEFEKLLWRGKSMPANQIKAFGCQGCCSRWPHCFRAVWLVVEKCCRYTNLSQRKGCIKSKTQG